MLQKSSISKSKMTLIGLGLTVALVGAVATNAAFAASKKSEMVSVANQLLSQEIQMNTLTPNELKHTLSVAKHPEAKSSYFKAQMAKAIDVYTGSALREYEAVQAKMLAVLAKDGIRTVLGASFKIDNVKSVSISGSTARLLLRGHNVYKLAGNKRADYPKGTYHVLLAKAAGRWLISSERVTNYNGS